MEKLRNAAAPPFVQLALAKNRRFSYLTRFGWRGRIRPFANVADNAGGEFDRTGKACCTSTMPDR
jgi:hypothetical protein